MSPVPNRRKLDQPGPFLWSTPLDTALLFPFLHGQAEREAVEPRRRVRNILMDTFIGDAIVMFGTNKVFRTKRGFSL
jgi:hypothetical protein